MLNKHLETLMTDMEECNPWQGIGAQFIQSSTQRFIEASRLHVVSFYSRCLSAVPELVELNGGQRSWVQR